MEPKVSVPKAKGTSPADVAEPEPAEEPLAPWVVSQGFFVFPTLKNTDGARYLQLFVFFQHPLCDSAGSFLFL